MTGYMPDAGEVFPRDHSAQDSTVNLEGVWLCICLRELCKRKKAAESPRSAPGSLDFPGRSLLSEVEAAYEKSGENKVAKYYGRLPWARKRSNLPHGLGSSFGKNPFLLGPRNLPPLNPSLKNPTIFSLSRRGTWTSRAATFPSRAAPWQGEMSVKTETAKP